MTRKTRVMFIVFTCLAVLTLLTGLFLPLSSVQAREGGSMVVSPRGMIIDTTPTIKWYRISIGTKYEYEVYKGTSTTPWEKVTNIGLGYCGTTYCTYTSSKVYPTGPYKWRARYFDGSVWSSWSEYLNFQVVPTPKDFYSPFNNSMAGWIVKPGAAWHVNSTSLYSNGADYQWSSIYNSTSPVFANFDFVIKAKSNTKYSDCLAVRMGSGFNTSININLGYPGYLFCFQTHGRYSIIWMDSTGGATYVQPWTDTAYINTYDWNRYRVIAVGPYFYFFINGNFMYYFKDSQRNRGYVGITMSKMGADPTFFEVDYAKLNVLYAASPLPDARISPEQQALNDAAMKGSAEPLIP